MFFRKTDAPFQPRHNEIITVCLLQFWWITAWKKKISKKMLDTNRKLELQRQLPWQRSNYNEDVDDDAENHVICISSKSRDYLCNRTPLVIAILNQYRNSRILEFFVSLSGIPEFFTGIFCGTFYVLQLLLLLSVQSDALCIVVVACSCTLVDAPLFSH